MRKYCPFVFATVLSVISANGFGQNTPWLEVGSEWTYQHRVFSGPEHYQAAYGITEEPRFAGRECAKMERISSITLGCMSIEPPFYFYVSNDSLYYAHPADSTFRLVADFGASVGDSWEYEVISDFDELVDDTSLVTVTDIEFLIIDGEEFRQLELDYEWLGSSYYEEMWLGLYGGKMTELIGSESFFAPFGRIGFCDYETTVNLQCFKSPSFDYLNPDYPCCDLIVSLDDTEGNSAIAVFPNPASEVVSTGVPSSWSGSETNIRLLN